MHKTTPLARRQRRTQPSRKRAATPSRSC